MTLATGTKLGPYEISGALGAGGMGEVYRARDTRLDRTVAIKVLPPEFSANPDRRQRFEREARTISSLNHPHICTLHDIGHQEGIDYLVMEYVEGETLAKKLEGGPLPTEAVLRYGIEIADALDKAHRQGVIHRDLKPGNIMLTKSGAKLLDFGLAKVLPHPGGLLSATPPTAAPTASQPLTAEGTLLGTFQYMSPEQLEGKEADVRSDLFALGTVLYEMAVGRPAFQGKSTASLITAILTSDPQPITTLQPMAPPALDRVVKTCVAKDRDDRWQTAHDVTVQLKWMAEGHLSVAAVSSPSPGARTALQGRVILWSLAALAVLSIGVTLGRLMRAPPPPTRPIARFMISLPPTDRLALGLTPVLALSPDGSRLVYVANHGGSAHLYVRSIDRFEATPISGTEGAENPFFSPDGQSVGFFAEGKLKKVSLSGGAPLTICSTVANRGASWGPDDTIIFTPSFTLGLFRVSAAGGTPKPLTVSDRKKGESGHRWPEILPGGKAVIFTIWTGRGFDDARIGMLSLETGERRVLVEGGTYARYVPSGHLVFARAGGLLAVPFDLTRLEVTGAPVSILEGVSMSPTTGAAGFSSSGNGSLAYVPGGLTVGEGTLVWVDRKGVAQALPAPSRAYISPRLSPDGERLAVGIVGTNPGLWLYELARGTLTRLAENLVAPFPIWTPDGKHLTLGSPLSGSFNLYWMPADGSGAAESLITSENAQWPGSWSPDGRLLAFSEQDPATGWDIWVLGLEGERKPRPFLQTASNESSPKFSPDGRWLAYASDESGRQEIYVRPFPGPGRKWQISTEGGTEPVWARNGQELFYRNGDKMMAAAVETKPAFAAAKPKLLFAAHYEKSPYPFLADYDVTPDGWRFLMIRASEQESAPTQLNVVLNWSDEVRRLVPAGRK